MIEFLWFFLGALSMFLFLLGVSVLLTIKRRKEAEKIVKDFMESDDYKSFLEDFDKIWNDESRD